MRSLGDRFWKQVGIWRDSKPKPTIVLEVSGGLGNWPLAVFRGTIRDFVSGRSIEFLTEGGELRRLDLRGCSVQVSERTKPKPDSELEAWNFVVSFKVLCPAAREEDDDGILVFTELRDFGKTN